VRITHRGDETLVEDGLAKHKRQVLGRRKDKMPSTPILSPIGGSKGNPRAALTQKADRDKKMRIRFQSGVQDEGPSQTRKMDSAPER